MSLARRTSFVELCSPVPLTHDLSVTASKAKLARQTPRPATQRQAQAELTRRKLLEAAVEHFSARHFDDVAASDITETAGVAQGLLFHYFGNKRGIYLEALRDAATRLNAATTPPPGDGAPGPTFDAVPTNRRMYPEALRDATGTLKATTTPPPRYGETGEQGRRML